MTQESTQIIDKNEDLVYTIKEVAGLLKVNKNYVYALINKGLPAINQIRMQKSNQTGFDRILRKKRRIELR